MAFIQLQERKDGQDAKVRAVANNRNIVHFTFSILDFFLIQRQAGLPNPVRGTERLETE